MRVISKRSIIKVLVIVAVFVVPFLASAQLPIISGAPGQTDPSKIDSIPGLISYVYNFAFWIVGIAVFFQVFRGGFIIFFGAAGSASKVGEARKIITDAIIGLILLFASWMILNVINPDLVTNTFDFGTLLSGGGSGGPTPSVIIGGPTPTPGASGGTPTPGGTPFPSTGQINGDWQITHYTVYSESRPGESAYAKKVGFTSSTGSCTTTASNGSTIESGSNCAFLSQTAIQGTGIIRDGRIIHVANAPCKGSSCKWTITSGIQGSYGNIFGLAGKVVASNVIGANSTINVPVLSKGGLSTQVTVKDSGAVSAFGSCQNAPKKHIDFFYYPDGPAEQLMKQMGINEGTFSYNVEGAVICKGKVRCGSKVCTF